MASESALSSSTSLYLSLPFVPHLIESRESRQQVSPSAASPCACLRQETGAKAAESKKERDNAPDELTRCAGESRQ